MKTILIIFSTLIIVYIVYRTYRTLTLDKGLEAKIDRGAIILDVRTEQEYKTGHIEGSINIPLGMIRTRYTELDPQKTYITCCSHGLRSVKVEKLLKERGFKNVFNGGAWVDLQQLMKTDK